jgi:hypothetical protein
MLRIIVILLLIAVAPGLAVAKDNPRPSTGDYTVSVAGYVTGSGKATVDSTKVKFDADVEIPGGQKGKLSASGLKISKGHFSGSGTVLGQAATFKGRLDVTDQVDEQALKAVRISCTVATADGKYLKLMGYLPAPPPGTPGTGTGTGGGGDDDDDDGGRDRGRGGATEKGGAKGGAAVSGKAK